ncbi:MAG TPA: hypothetical protein PK668_15500 [Myxococcota bacterium]|nr:hypothetical protein [Myxococcota bacterium]HRY94300.1 hypothetical protein [Myxococcota bacterium]
MVRVSIGFRASGPKFSPKNVERHTGIRFSKKNEPGDIGTIGRYRDHPLPYGSCELNGPETGVDLQVPDPSFFESIEGAARECLMAGATSMLLHLDVAYTDQCNLELSKDFVSALARAGVSITMSCYEDS